MIAVEANADGLIGPTHSYAGLSPGNLASSLNRGEPSNPRAAALEGLAKMKRLADLGLPQFVLPPHERPFIPLLRDVGFAGSDEQVLQDAWRQAPGFAAAACSASAMWTANAATVTAGPDSRDGRAHLTPANLVSNLHRGLEAPTTTAALRALFPHPDHFAVHQALPPAPHLSDEGAANHVRLCSQHGQAGVDLFVYGRDAWEPWPHAFPARQTLQASQAVARRHGSVRPVFARQGQAAIAAGAFHNDVVCVGALSTLFFHEAAFEDTDALIADIRRAADGLFEPQFVMVSEAELPLAHAIASYLFNSMLVALPGRGRLTLVCPVETRDDDRSRAVVEGLVASNGPIGHVEYVDVRQSMRNGGGPACLRLRVVLTEPQLDAVYDPLRLDDSLYAGLTAWVEEHYRDRLAPSDLADPALMAESREALDRLAALLDLGGRFYAFQRG